MRNLEIEIQATGSETPRRPFPLNTEIENRVDKQ